MNVSLLSFLHLKGNAPKGVFAERYGILFVGFLDVLFCTLLLALGIFLYYGYNFSGLLLWIILGCLLAIVFASRELLGAFCSIIRGALDFVFRDLGGQSRLLACKIFSPRRDILPNRIFDHTGILQICSDRWHRFQSYRLASFARDFSNAASAAQAK
jgi:hypothetical protein